MLSKVSTGLLVLAATVPTLVPHGVPDVLPAAPTASTTASADFEWHGRMSEGQVLEIRGINGGIVAVAASGSEAVVSAEKSGRNYDPDEVEIVVIEHPEGITICAVYPTPEGSRHENRCAPGGEGHMNLRNNDVTVEFRVEVPAGVRYVPRTVNGDIRATDLRSDIMASTVNGSVDLSTSGSAEATTVNGSIEATMGETWESEATFSTVNGGISLHLPATVNADVHARTVNGEITTDYPLTVRGRFGPRSIDGTLGEGGPTIELETVNGGIALRRSN